MKAPRNLKALIPLAIYVASVPANGVPPDTTIGFDDFPRQPANGMSVAPVYFFTGPDVFFNEELESVYPGSGETTLIEHALVGNVGIVGNFDSFILVNSKSLPSTLGLLLPTVTTGMGKAVPAILAQGISAGRISLEWR